MLNILPQPIIALIAFLITIGILVTIHEFGHFWVARKFGVKIEKFSIGFGKPIIKWIGKRDNTEYSISWIPLGGYVKMYGESSNKGNDNIKDKNNPDDIKPSKVQNNQKHDISDFYDAKNINNQEFESENSTRGSFSALPPYKRFLIAFAGPAVNFLFAILAFWVLFMLGTPNFAAGIGKISPNSQFASTKFKYGDIINEINGREINTIDDAILTIVNFIGQKNVLVNVKRGDQIVTDSIDLSGFKSGDELNVNDTLGFDWEIKSLMDSIALTTLSQVSPDSPASKAGLIVGDKIIAINQIEINEWAKLVEIISGNLDVKLELLIERNGKQLNLELTPKQHPNNPKRGYAGFSPSINQDAKLSFEKLSVTQKYGPVTALVMAIKQPVYLAQVTLKTMGRLLTGNASTKNLGGPLTIADISGQAIGSGIKVYLNFLAGISLSLAVMNLLPIPVLDGGHMLLCVAEMVKGKPLNEKAVDILMRIGLSIVLSLMVFIVSMDLFKYLFKYF